MEACGARADHRGSGYSAGLNLAFYGERLQRNASRKGPVPVMWRWMAIGVVVGASGLLRGSAAVEPPQEPHAYSLQGDFWFTHDPSIAKDGSTYYVFATGKAPGGGQLPLRCSEDLSHWRMCGHVFDAIPQWIQQRSPGTKELWAPDISHTALLDASRPRSSDSSWRGSFAAANARASRVPPKVTSHATSVPRTLRRGPPRCST